MNAFPNHISHLDHLRANKMISFKDETVNSETFTIVSYSVADSELWDDHLARECRGITYDSKGRCVSVPFQKFFNVGERIETLPDIVQNEIYDGGFLCLDKRDGSMVHPVIVGEEIFFKSKKSFFSSVAIEATRSVDPQIAEMCLCLLKENWTPIFEYTSPYNRVVLDYGPVPQFKLLAIRNTENGRYKNYSDMIDILQGFELGSELLIEPSSVAAANAIHEITSMTDIEGVVLADFDQGKFYKVKTEWYLNLHHARTDLRERDVARMVAEETVDDLKSFLSQNGLDLGPVEHIEHQVASHLAEITAFVEDCVQHAKNEGMTMKECAQYFSGSYFFSLIMLTLRGKNPNIKKFWLKEFLPNYSLKTIFTTFNHGNLEDRPVCHHDDQHSAGCGADVR